VGDPARPEHERTPANARACPTAVRSGARRARVERVGGRERIPRQKAQAVRTLSSCAHPCATSRTAVRRTQPGFVSFLADGKSSAYIMLTRCPFGREKIVAKMHAVRMSKHGHAASFARGPHDNPRSHTDVRAGHQPASQRRDTQGRQSTASGGVVKPHDGYAPRMRIPRAERYEVHDCDRLCSLVDDGAELEAMLTCMLRSSAGWQVVLRRQIREAVASMCPGYNEEELIQMARDDPRARVMIPRAIRMRNETRSVRTGMRGVLQDGCDNVRTILQMQSRNEKELARTRAPEDSTRSDMHARNRVSDSTRFRPHQEPS